MLDPRPAVRGPKLGEITQGTIFSCVNLDHYKNCDVYGLVITARCDVAQQKFPVLSFLPIVLFKDWLRRDGLDMLMQMEESSQIGNIKETLRQAGLSDAIWGKVPSKAICANHFSSGKTKQEKKRDESFQNHVDRFEEFQQLKLAGDRDLSFEWFQQNREKDLKKLVSRLFKHDVLGHYLLETLSHGGPADPDEPIGYICLLREVRSLPKNIANKLGNGLSESAYRDCCGGSKPNDSLEIGPEGLAMPIAVIKSPTVEHILQCFSHLFGRIGVADPDEVLVERLTAQSQET